MAERFVSPGVFTRENDLSFLPQGIAEIGGAFIGPFVQGPAFVPTIVDSADDFRDKFGNPIPEFYAPHAAINYLNDAARATIVRVLGLGGYSQTEQNALIIQAVSDTGSVTLGIISPTRNTVGVTSVALITGSLTPDRTGSTDFDMLLENGNSITSSFTSMSIVATDPNYWVKALGEGAGGAEVGFTALNFPRSVEVSGSAITGSEWNIVLTAATGSNAYQFDGSDYNHASTPFIQSQTIGGKRHNLFKVHTFSDGNASNAEIKVSIQAVRPAATTADDQHGTFALVVRKFSDTDQRQTVIEQFDNLSLDPDSPNYVARVIGDIHFEFDSIDELVEIGEFASNSKNIYIELAAGIEAIPDLALPTGFGALRTPVGGDAVADGSGIPSVIFVTTRFETPVGSSEAIENSRIFYGFDYTDETNLAYLNPIPNSSSIDSATFNLEDLTGVDLLFTSESAIPVTGSSIKKFTVPLQGGFDGLNPSRVLATAGDITAANTQGFDLTDSLASGSVAYQRAIDIISNPEAFDINLVIVPGVIRRIHAFVTQITIDMCEARGDCFYIMDNVEFGKNVDTAVSTAAGIDTNYAGVYHPWVKVLDVNSNKNIWVTPSTALAQVFAFNDKVAAPWFAPAGLNRGGITAAVQVEKRLTRQQRDDLYDGRVNPIALFPGTGVVAYGQKTLQVAPSALDRINVRRLLISVKKFIASSARFLVFEQNVDSTRQRFLNIANPFLASIQERSGLFAFKVIMDESNNTPDLIDRNILVGQIFLQPTRTAEFISLEFNILPTGATFPDGA